MIKNPQELAELVECWMHESCLSERDDDQMLLMSPAMLADFAEWVSATQREFIAQMLESMPANISARQFAQVVRTMRAQH